MYYIRATNGRVLWRADESIEDGTVTPLTDETPMPEETLPVSVDEFEAAAREDAGLAEDEPIGEVYVEDEREGVAFGSPAHDGKRVGGKRVTAYAPGNPVTELMEELGKNERQSVSWSDLQRIMELINGER